jgi:nicotinamide riboside transporter PnuC
MKHNCAKIISFGLLIITSVVLVFASMVEKLQGREAALSKIYHSEWFAALWAALFVSAFIFMIRRRFHLYCLFAFLSVLMTFLGVSFLMSGVHSYL